MRRSREAMNEWIDCIVFSLQAAAMWIALPRWCARFTRPMLMDRNPEWALANPGTVAMLEHGGWWMKTIRAWGLLTILVLVAFRLGLQPPALSPQALRTPLWEVLMTVGNLMTAVGLLLFGYGVVAYFRWQKQHVPLTERRQATLAPRSTDDYLPRWMQYLVYALMLVSLLARPVASFFQPGRIVDVWGNFFMGVVLMLLLFFVGMGSVMRAPNHMDRTIGPAYRRMEVRVCFGLMALMALLGLVNLAVELSVADPKRYGSVVISLFVTVTLAGFMLLPAAPRDGSGGEDAPWTGADTTDRNSVA
jgi:hypothetical protein